jgi:hypothetical protein
MSNGGQPWWYAQCLANIQKMPPPYNVMCEVNHCDNNMVQAYSELVCSCQPPYQNGCAPTPTPGCCPYSATSPVPVLSLSCFCCCGCFANNTPVAFGKDQYKPIIEFEVDVDTIYVADDVSLKSWSRRPVRFSSGAGDAGAANMMLKVTYGAPTQDYLLVNRGQLFLLPDRTLKPAASLIPGTDSLITADGTPHLVVALEAGIFKKGMHHVATSTRAATSPDGHLLLAKGIVCGDWALQIALSSPAAHQTLPLAKDLGHAPEFGTREYSAMAPHLEHKPFRSIVPGTRLAAVPRDEFEPFDSDDAIEIPKDAFAFLTLDQSRDIHDSASIAPPLSQAGKESLHYLFKLFGAFYPIEFDYDERNVMPNAYYFEKDDGTGHVVVTGGLVRCKDMNYEGLALAIASVVGATTGGPPLNDSGVSCIGIAAYSAVGDVMTSVFLGLGALPIIKAGMPQLESLFARIQPKHRGGSDTCMNISTTCRIEAMNAAFNMMPLPYCAGGPPDPTLEVVGATATAGLPHSVVTVTFNAPVDQVTGLAPANYAFDPLAEAFAADPVAGNPSAVAIKVNLALKTSYTVTAVGVLSLDQQPLVPGQDTASFTTK